MARLQLVSIDELHCVMSWGDFRPDYRALQVLRHRLPLGIPWFGASATLRPEVLATCLNDGGFAGQDTNIICQNLNRENIYCDLRVTQFPTTSFQDLQFVFPPARPEGTRAQDWVRKIPKTIIFMSESSQINKARYKLVELLQTQFDIDEDTAKAAVKAYYRGHSDYTKERFYEEFLNPESDIRILLATDAIGVGMNIPDVVLVIQWGLPASIDQLLQRLGRAGRRISLEAFFVWFVSPAHFAGIVGKEKKSDRDETEEASSSSAQATEAPRRKPKYQYWKKSKPSAASLLVHLRQFLKLDRCFRQNIWAPYETDEHRYTLQSKRCCMFCHPSPEHRLPVTSLDDIVFTTRDAESVAQWKLNPRVYSPPKEDQHIVPFITQALAQWAERVAWENLLGTIFTPETTNELSMTNNELSMFEMVMPRATLKSIALIGSHITTVDLLKSVVPNWSFCARYGEDVVQLIWETERCCRFYHINHPEKAVTTRTWVHEHGFTFIPKAKGQRPSTQQSSQTRANSPVGTPSSKRGRPRNSNTLRSQTISQPSPLASQCIFEDTIDPEAPLTSQAPAEVNSSSTPSFSEAEDSTRPHSSPVEPPAVTNTTTASTQPSVRGKKRPALEHLDVNVQANVDSIPRGQHKRTIKLAAKSTLRPHMFQS